MLARCKLLIVNSLHWSHFCNIEMKQILMIMKRRFLSFCGAAALAIGFTACNSDGTTSDISDSTNSTTTNSTTSMPDNTSVSVGNYAAMADSVERNSQQGYYLNPRTGKAYSSLKVDRSTGRVTDDGGEPVWRYVDRRNWWVYGGDDWSQVGEARMEDDKLMYKGDGDKWLDYDTRWSTYDMEMEKKWKSKDGDMKIKTEKDGDMKIKVGDEKIKVDEDGTKKKN